MTKPRSPPHSAYPGGGERVNRNRISEPLRDQKYEEYCRFRNALAILRRASNFSEQPDAYFKSRGIDRCPAVATLLPASEVGKLTNNLPGREGQRLLVKNAPVMVMPIINGQRLLGVHTTVLDLRSTAKLNDNARRVFGLKRGGYILLSTIDANEPMVVGEGVETTASAMQIAGLQGVAAIDAGNFASVDLPACSELIIARDRGNVGRDAAETLAQRYAARLTVRIAVPPKGYSDWNDAHQAALKGDLDLDVLKRSILRARLYEEEASAGEGYARTMEEMMALQVPARPYLLKPWLTARGSGQIHAMRGVGKTRFALSVAYAVATGKPLLDWQVEQRARVLYVDAELDLDDLKGRLKALGPNADDLRVISFDDLFNRGVELPDLGRPEGRAFFDRQFDLFDPGLVILDSLTFLAKVAENEAEAWDPIADWIVSHRRRGRTVLWVHHQGRSGRARGTSKREDGIEVSVALKARDDLTDEDDDNSAFELVFDKHRGFAGTDAAPRVVKFSLAGGYLEWSSETKRENIKTRISELLEQGYKQVEIAKELNISKGRVSQLVRQLQR